VKLLEAKALLLVMALYLVKIQVEMFLMWLLVTTRDSLLQQQLEIL
jgi:hypothetical protein